MWKAGAPAVLRTSIRRRLAMFDEERARQLALRQPSGEQVMVTMTHPASPRIVLDGPAGATSIRALLKPKHSHLLASAVAARVDGRLMDLAQPVNTSCEAELVTIDETAGREVFWHSSAHVLGAALEQLYGDAVRLCDGPAIDRGGFFYEFALADPHALSPTPADFAAIDAAAAAVVAKRLPFERLVVARELALDMFHDNEFKQHFIAKAPSQAPVSLYRCGDFIDFCRGPHIAHTAMVKAFATTQVSKAYWLSDQKQRQLDRVYGISFSDQKQFDKWKEQQEEAKQRDHRVIGKRQRLFMMHPLSPGSAFMLPHGAHICNRLIELMRSMYHSRSYKEVITPQVFSKELWEISGHWENYREDMFIVQSGKTSGLTHNHAHQGHTHSDADHGVFALKPMNCPGHCLIFGSTLYSYRELPIRIADFSPLHRNEISGALSGLTRVRKFMQDDAHIFCREDQVGDEVAGVLDMISKVYGAFGFTFNLALSTRPEKYLGDLTVWDRAEAALRDALGKLNKPYVLAEGDGAFYGPKIDITVEDAAGRKHQTATVQLDFQLPERFQLSYVDRDGSKQRPVIIHRAVLGSVERMLGILTEHYNGKWPFWLSPRQACIMPVNDNCVAYGQALFDQLHKLGCTVEMVPPSSGVNRNVYDAIKEGFNYILVVGQREVEQGTVSVRDSHRSAEDKTPKAMAVADVVALFAGLNQLPL